jgi:tRNA G10  N-methylase Trm11
MVRIMMHKSLLILGRQPAIGRAELESLFGAERVQPAGDDAALVAAPASEIPFARLGSSVKLGEVLGVIEHTEWSAVQRESSKLALHRAQDLSEGKIQLGLSVHGLQVTPARLNATGLELKKQLRKVGYSVRLVPSQGLALSSAQVLHNHLAGERGLELLLVRSGSHVIVARTAAVQDITAYARRDQGRPKRDARVGMLPPKLAQTIVNLATGPLPPSPEAIVLDPFCGTGVVLQEALLMGYGAYGTDLEPRMIDYTRANLEWLATHGPTHETQLEVGDATAHQWGHPFSVIASETYLGRPLSSWPDSDTMRDIMSACNTIIEKSLVNLSAQLKPGQRLCLAVPAWRSPHGAMQQLPLLDHLGELGYNRIRFEHARDTELVYYRPEQLVARELLVITRK